jgi:hypothetical protein
LICENVTVFSAGGLGADARAVAEEDAPRDEAPDETRAPVLAGAAVLLGGGALVAPAGGAVAAPGTSAAGVLGGGAAGTVGGGATDALGDGAAPAALTFGAGAGAADAGAAASDGAGDALASARDRQTRNAVAGTATSSTAAMIPASGTFRALVF